MSLRLIVGRAGSGKSSLIYDEIAARVEQEPDEQPLWLLVPEQATFQVEQALCDRLGGIMRVRVVSFQRLAHYVMNSVAGAVLTPIGDLGRLMLVRKVIEEKRKELKLFARVANQPGFAAKMLDLISELKRHAIRPADLARVLEQGLPPTLTSKLCDLYLIYSGLTDKYNGVSLDADDRLEWLAEHVTGFAAIEGRELWLDGYTGFTPQEYAILERLLKMCSVAITLPLDPAFVEARLTENNPFFTPWETCVKLRQLCGHLGLKSEVLPLGSKAACDASELRYLEHSYFQPEAEPHAGVPETLKLLAAESRRVEVEQAAREILRLCRDEGYRYREVSIVLRDLGLYEPFLANILKTYDIPFFLDQKRAVKHHPLLELVKSALEAIEDDFPYEPTLRCLKTDLWPLERDVVDRVDNFALATGIRGAAWVSEAEWRVSDPELGQLLNNARKTCREGFAPLQVGLKEGATVREKAMAMVSFLSYLGVEQTLNHWVYGSEKQGELDAAMLHAQVGRVVFQLFDELVLTLGDERLTLSEFARLVESGLEGINLGLVPLSIDQVIITELGRSRSKATRATFILGVNDGVLPAKSSPEGLLTDEERALLSSLSVNLGPNSRRQLFEEEYLVYVGLTRGLERLYVSYAISDEEGGALKPSLVVRRLRELFPGLEDISVHAKVPQAPDRALAYIEHPHSTAGLLAGEMRRAATGGEIAALWWDVYNNLLENARFRPLLNVVVRGLLHEIKARPLPRSVVTRLYGRALQGSVSRLERFRACPFSYFAGYGLKLRERPIYRLAAVDLGNFFHLALDRFVDNLNSRGLDWGVVTREQYGEITAGIVESLVPQIGGEILTSTARYKYLTKRLQQVVERSARVLGQHAQRGRFRPTAVEIGFGATDDRLPALKIELSDGSTMELVGRIDRVDVAELGEHVYLRIIDYKSGYHRLTPLEVYYGLKTQLLTYLEVALNHAVLLLGKEASPAGALYFRLQDPFLTANGPLTVAEVEEQSFKDFKLSGVVLADKAVVDLMDEGVKGWSQVIPVMVKTDGDCTGESAWTLEQMSSMLEHLRRSYRASGEEILSGNVSIAPYRLAKSTGCQFCDYLAVCQFDNTLPDGLYRELKKLEPREVWRLVCHTGGENNGPVD